MTAAAVASRDIRYALPRAVGRSNVGCQHRTRAWPAVNPFRLEEEMTMQQMRDEIEDGLTAFQELIDALVEALEDLLAAQSTEAVAEADIESIGLVPSAIRKARRVLERVPRG